MALTEIEYGSVASSEILNNNYEYLDNRISSLFDNVNSINSSLVSLINSQISTLNGKFSSQIETTDEKLQEIENKVQEDIADLEQSIITSFKNIAPDYSKAIGISLPYTAQKDGWVFAGTNGIDYAHFVYVNGKPVIAESGYSGGKLVYGGGLFPVSKGDVVTVTTAYGSYYFYPLKGVN